MEECIIVLEEANGNTITKFLQSKETPNIVAAICRPPCGKVLYCAWFSDPKNYYSDNQGV